MRLKSVRKRGYHVSTNGISIGALTRRTDDGILLLSIIADDDDDDYNLFEGKVVAGIC